MGSAPKPQDKRLLQSRIYTNIYSITSRPYCDTSRLWMPTFQWNFYMGSMLTKMYQIYFVRRSMICHTSVLSTELEYIVCNLDKTVNSKWHIIFDMFLWQEHFLLSLIQDLIECPLHMVYLEYPCWLHNNNVTNFKCHKKIGYI
jgi:hypothetical protein